MGEKAPRRSTAQRWSITSQGSNLAKTVQERTQHLLYFARLPVDSDVLEAPFATRYALWLISVPGHLDSSENNSVRRRETWVLGSLRLIHAAGRSTHVPCVELDSLCQTSRSRQVGAHPSVGVPLPARRYQQCLKVALAHNYRLPARAGGCEIRYVPQPRSDSRPPVCWL